MRNIACNYPLHAICSGINTETGKKKLHILKTVEYYDLPLEQREKCIELPCGHCVECRLKYSRQWADRLMIEAQSYPEDEKWFITLTYDELHLPLSDWCDFETGECGSVPTLVKSHIQKFVKRLRANYEYECEKLGSIPNHIKYYLCGEYGSSTGRPHYHLIVFGLPLGLSDLFPFKKTPQGFWLWNSKTIEKAWSYEIKDKQGNVKRVPYGYSVVSNVSWDTCAYVARYVLKKKYGEASNVYEKYNIVPEFVLMSRKPAIGREYFDTHKEEIYKHDEFYISTADGGRSVRPSRYYDTLYDLEFPEEMQAIKEKRLAAQNASMSNKLRQTSLEEEQFLITQDKVKTDCINNALRRKL